MNKGAMSKELDQFMRWFELEYPKIKLSEKQMNVLSSYFLLKDGEGKIFIAKALLEYDRSGGISCRQKFTMKSITKHQ